MNNVNPMQAVATSANPTPLANAVNTNLNQKGESPFIGLGTGIKDLEAVLLHYMPKDHDGRNRIIADVELSHQLAGSLHHYSFLEHIALNLRRRLALSPAPDQYFDADKNVLPSCYGALEVRNNIANAFTIALCECCGDIYPQEVAQCVNRELLKELRIKKKDANGEILKDENGEDIYSIVEWTDKLNGRRLNPCPFGVDGASKLDKSNLDTVLSYIVNDFSVIKIIGGKRGFAMWDRYGYTENPNRMKEILKDYLKSYRIQLGDREVTSLIDAISISGEPRNRDPRLLIPTKTGLVHVFHNKLDQIKPEEVSAYPPLKPFYQGDGFEVCYPDPNVIVTRVIDAEFNPYAKDPELVQCMHEWSNHNANLFKVLCQAGGWIISGTKEFRGILIFTGSSGCGKSAYCDIVKGVIGIGKYSTVSMKQLANDQGFFFHRLIDVRANFAEEVPSNELSISLQNQLKDISGGDGGSEINEKNTSPYDAIIQANLIFNTNVLPPVSDEVTRQRIAVIPFLNPNSKRGKANVKAMAQRKSAKSVALNLYIAGLVDLVRNGGDFFADHFTQCKELSDAMNFFEQNGSTEFEWVQDKLDQNSRVMDRYGAELFCFPNANGATMEQLKSRTCRSQWREYKDWCKDNKRNADKEGYFKELLANVWRKVGIRLEVKKHTNGDYFIDPDNPNAHPNTRQTKAEG